MSDDAVKPFDSGRLDVGDGHDLYYEQVGVPDGVPVVYLHGGPGSGATVGAREFFDRTVHRGVLFDQRAAGRSTPRASDPSLRWDAIDMDHHVADIEHLREHLGIDRWAVFGISWGTVLGTTYAQRHPDRVTSVVLAAVSTGTAADVDWLTVGVGRYFPEQWQAFQSHIPLALRGMRLVDAYHDLVMNPDPAVHQAAADAWCRWEDAHVATTPSAKPSPRYEDPDFRLGFARQVTHCWTHDHWLLPDEIINRADRLSSIPGHLVHGRLDLSSPLMQPWRLHQAWTGSTLTVVDDEGHGGDRMSDHWSRILAYLP